VIVCRSLAEVRSARKALASPVGFVATMGALHAGHESLLRRSRADDASVVASIYVNPLQFGPNEDLARYPRTFEADAALIERVGVDVLFAPSDDEMYPAGPQATIDQGPVARYLEGERRPGHFRGVATIVLKLFNVVAPDRAYFGQKDAQQLAVVRRMVADLNLPVEVVGCPIVRERDGLAHSSRIRYLGEKERRDAVGLARALTLIVEAIKGGATDLGATLRAAAAEMHSLRVDYLEVVDPREFVPLKVLPPRSALLAAGAAFCGETRLIDNMEVETR
jgi:pantoate--beta-alanine ligase